MTWNFFFNRRLTFSHTRGDSSLPQYWKFVGDVQHRGADQTGSSAATCPYKIVFFNAHLLAAAVVGILVGLLFNFTLSQTWVFRHRTTGLSGPPRD